MKFKDNIYDFTFYPVNYEFDNFNKDSDIRGHYVFFRR